MQGMNGEQKPEQNRAKKQQNCQNISRHKGLLQHGLWITLWINLTK
jgi:hypothetical protein